MDASAERTDEAPNAFELPRPAAIVATANRTKRGAAAPPEQRNVVGVKREQPGRTKSMRSR